MDQCSIWAYEDIVNSGALSERLAMFMSVFVDNRNHPMTAREATGKVRDKFKYKFPVSSYTARCSDLMRMGYLKKTDRVRCSVSNKIVNRWAWTGLRSKVVDITIKVKCKHCNGTGHVTEKIYSPDKN
jgi:hypothetical protein